MEYEIRRFKTLAAIAARNETHCSDLRHLRRSAFFGPLSPQ